MILQWLLFSIEALRRKIFNLDPASVGTHIAQALDLPGYMKKVLITNKVTAHFFITLFKPISYTLHAPTLAGSRFKMTRWYGIG